MQRDSRAYLADILESCDAISTALSGMQIGDYLSNRLVRSSVEREFIIIGEAVLALSHKASTYRFSEVNALHWFWGSILRTNIKTQRTVPYALF
jgi:uncharacterized protein with HEPN domain